MQLEIMTASFLVAVIAEAVWPLRRPTQPKLRRVLRNLSFATVSAAVVHFAFLPFEIWAASFTQISKIGLLNFVQLPLGLKRVLGFILLEYGMYWWHYLNHRIGFLWRFHNVHHIDLDVDVSTASRFHVGELGISAVYRVVQIFLIGIDIPTLLVFETCVIVFSQFQHSNFALPKSFERLLCKITMTPRMHGIHHSIVLSETDSNFGTALSLWDRLHGTFQFGIPQSAITIGVPAYRDPAGQSFFKILIMPFQKPRAWKLPSGEIPVRAKT